MPDYWRCCGYRLLTVRSDGRLDVTDDFLRASLLRPELAPVAESCAAELALHDKLMAVPRGVVDEAELAALDDPDIRENYAIWLRFRGRLTSAPSLEAAYMGSSATESMSRRCWSTIDAVLLRHLAGRAPPIRCTRASPKCCFARRRSPSATTAP